MPFYNIQLKKISAREWSVLRMLAEGVRPSTIAKKLSISIKTVSQHTTNLERKLGAENRLLLQKKLVFIKHQGGCLRN